MASLFYLILAGFLLPAAHSLTCSSQKFANRTFAHCEDLPHLDAFIHWTYDSKNSSLSLAFLAPPPRPGGWVAWAVNPTATGMAGAQALLVGGSGAAPSVRTFNISSYSSVVPSPELSFPVWDVAAESTGGRFTIYAKLKVPAKATSLNQVWQVGPAVDPSGGLTVHEFKPANLNARGVLEFVKSKKRDASPAPRAHGGASPAPAPAPAVVGRENGTATAAPGPDKGGAAGIRSRNLGSVLGLFLFVWGIIVF